MAIKQNWIYKENWIEQNLMFDFLTQSNKRLWLVGRMFSCSGFANCNASLSFPSSQVTKQSSKSLTHHFIFSFPHIEQLEKSAMTTQEDKEKIQSLEGNKWP